MVPPLALLAKLFSYVLEVVLGHFYPDAIGVIDLLRSTVVMDMFQLLFLNEKRNLIFISDDCLPAEKRIRWRISDQFRQPRGHCQSSLIFAADQERKRGAVLIKYCTFTPFLLLFKQYAC
ncbi:MAG: hypothetical protein ABFS09_10850 [Thermodesulfobacteriota bacterium]